jgi:Head domain of trimeric autotransporter adhesin/Chaperone of endosialidase
MLSGTIVFCFPALSQNIGIGTVSPSARLQVTDSNVVFSAAGDIPGTTGGASVSGAGRRMLWYADKAAFRAGYVLGTAWDKTNIGFYSFAAGYNTTASGSFSVAMGNNTVAGNSGCIAIGHSCIANGVSSVSIGQGEASGENAISIGFNSSASGDFSMALGDATQASGFSSTAMGTLAQASGDYSIAIGYGVSTNGHTGALVMGDASATTLNAASDNSFRARFDNGYRFYTSGDLSTNAYLAAGDNAWSTSSDVRKKENFEEINGEQVLEKIGRLHLGTWNYKNQNPKTFRHYGPMAQDFYGAFGKDKYGSIGNDTTINQADFNGLNMVAIEALEKRTEKIAQLEAKNKQLETALDKLQQKIDRIDREFSKKKYSAKK